MINIIGLIGVVLCLLPYVLVQMGRISPTGMWYPGLNLVGSICLMISLMVYWNTASMTIESIWFIASLFGLIRASRSKA